MARSLILLALIVVVLGGLFFVLRPEKSAVPRDRTFELSIKGGEMSPDEVSVHEDDRVTLRISSDKPMKFHVHGYDVEDTVRPGSPADLHFRADLTGRFEIEDHESERELGVLQVRPR